MLAFFGRKPTIIRGLNSGAQAQSNIGYQYSSQSSATYNGNAGNTINALGVYIYVDPTWKFTIGGGNSNALMFPIISGPNELSAAITVEYGTSNATSVGGNAGDPVVEMYNANNNGGVLFDVDTSPQYLSTQSAQQPGWIYFQQQQDYSGGR